MTHANVMMKYALPKYEDRTMPIDDKVEPIDFFNISFGRRLIPEAKISRNLNRIRKIQFDSVSPNKEK